MRKRRGNNGKPANWDHGKASMSGADGDGKVHDLPYWIESGFLTMPRRGADAAPGESG